MLKLVKVKSHKLEDGRTIYYKHPIPFSAYKAMELFHDESTRDKGLAGLIGAIVCNKDGSTIEEFQGKDAEWFLNNIDVQELANLAPVIHKIVGVDAQGNLLENGQDK